MDLPARSTPRDSLVISLAGPFASLAGTVITALLIPAAWSHTGVAFGLIAATVLGLLCFVENLKPRGEDPWHEATSVAPPSG